MEQLPVVTHEYSGQQKWWKELIPRLWLQIIGKVPQKVNLHQIIVKAYSKARSGKDG